MSNTCLICQNPVSYKKLYQFMDSNLKDSYDIFECPTCHVGKTSPWPTDLSVFYKEDSYNKPQEGLNYYLKGILLRHEIKRIIHHTKTKKILDLGCGFGDLSKNAFNMGLEPIAADASQQHPYYLKSIPEIPYLHFNYETLELQNPQKIEGAVVILRHVLEHIKDPHSFLKQWKKYKAGYVYIVLPNFDRPELRFFKNCDNLLGLPYHLWHFNLSSLKALLRTIDAKIIGHGFDTIPTVVDSFNVIIRQKNCPQMVKSILQSKLFYILGLPLNIFFPNNVVWVIAKINHD